MLLHWCWEVIEEKKNKAIKWLVVAVLSYLDIHHSSDTDEMVVINQFSCLR